MCLLLIGFIIQKPVTIAATYMVAALYLVSNQKNILFKNQHILIWALMAGVCMLASLTFNHGATPIFYLTVTPFLFLSARHLANKCHVHIVDCLKNVYWIFAIAIAIVIVKNWDDPVPLEVFSWSSTNGIPSYFIVVQIAYSLVYYLKSNRLPILSAIATLSVAVFGLGRGSMVTATLILLVSIIFNVTFSKSIADRRNVLILIAITIIIMVANYNDISSAVDLWIEGSKFSSGVLDEHRGRMINDYLKNIDGWTLIFGMDYAGTSISQYYGGNPHNSFIRIHSFYGLQGLLFIFFPLLFIIASNREGIQKVVAIVFISLSLLRSSTETIFFPSTLDFFYFLYFFIFMKFSKKRQKANLTHA
jgi:hypothetical protein